MVKSIKNIFSKKLTSKVEEEEDGKIKEQIIREGTAGIMDKLAHEVIESQNAYVSYSNTLWFLLIFAIIGNSAFGHYLGNSLPTDFIKKNLSASIFSKEFIFAIIIIAVGIWFGITLILTIKNWIISKNKKCTLAGNGAKIIKNEWYTLKYETSKDFQTIYGVQTDTYTKITNELKNFKKAKSEAEIVKSHNLIINYINDDWKNGKNNTSTKPIEIINIIGIILFGFLLYNIATRITKCGYPIFGATYTYNPLSPILAPISYLLARIGIGGNVLSFFNYLSTPFYGSGVQMFDTFKLRRINITDWNCEIINNMNIHWILKYIGKFLFIPIAYLWKVYSTYLCASTILNPLSAILLGIIGYVASTPRVFVSGTSTPIYALKKNINMFFLRRWLFYLSQGRSYEGNTFWGFIRRFITMGFDPWMMDSIFNNDNLKLVCNTSSDEDNKDNVDNIWFFKIRKFMTKGYYRQFFWITIGVTIITIIFNFFFSSFNMFGITISERSSNRFAGPIVGLALLILLLFPIENILYCLNKIPGERVKTCLNWRSKLFTFICGRLSAYTAYFYSRSDHNLSGGAMSTNMNTISGNDKIKEGNFPFNTANLTDSEAKLLVGTNINGDDLDKSFIDNFDKFKEKGLDTNVENWNSMLRKMSNKDLNNPTQTTNALLSDILLTLDINIFNEKEIIKKYSSESTSNQDVANPVVKFWNYPVRNYFYKKKISEEEDEAEDEKLFGQKANDWTQFFTGGSSNDSTNLILSACKNGKIAIKKDVYRDFMTNSDTISSFKCYEKYCNKPRCLIAEREKNVSTNKLSNNPNSITNKSNNTYYTLKIDENVCECKIKQSAVSNEVVRQNAGGFLDEIFQPSGYKNIIIIDKDNEEDEISYIKVNPDIGKIKVNGIDELYDYSPENLTKIVDIYNTSVEKKEKNYDRRDTNIFDETSNIDKKQDLDVLSYQDKPLKVDNYGIESYITKNGKLIPTRKIRLNKKILRKIKK